jgi:hypothetical protein
VVEFLIIVVSRQELFRITQLDAFLEDLHYSCTYYETWPRSDNLFQPWQSWDTFHNVVMRFFDYQGHWMFPCFRYCFTFIVMSVALPRTCFLSYLCQYIPSQWWTGKLFHRCTPWDQVWWIITCLGMSPFFYSCVVLNFQNSICNKCTPVCWLCC